MSETKTVVISMKVGDSVIETLNLPIGIDMMDVKILEIQKFDVIIEVQYEEWELCY